MAVVVQASGLGGLCTAVPALRALRRGLPHRLVLAAPVELAPVVALAEVADELAPTRTVADPLCSRLRGADLAIDLHGPDPQSWAAVDALGARRTIGYRREGSPRWLDEEPERQRWCRLVREATGLPADPRDLRVAPHPAWADRSTGVVVHPGGAAACRWPMERFAAVVGHLVDAGLSVTLTGGPDEAALAQDVVDALAPRQAEQVIDRGRTTDLAERCRTIAAADLVICGDTGVGHLAAAFGRRSIHLFGPTDPRRWGPPSGGRHRVLWARRAGDPHGEHPDPGLLEIAVVDVLDAVDAQLAEASPWTWATRAR